MSRFWLDLNKNQAKILKCQVFLLEFSIDFDLLFQARFLLEQWVLVLLYIGKVHLQSTGGRRDKSIYIPSAFADGKKCFYTRLPKWSILVPEYYYLRKEKLLHPIDDKCVRRWFTFASISISALTWRRHHN